MNKNAMLEALRRRKGQGLDVSILIAPPPGEEAAMEDEKGGKDGMAPEATVIPEGAAPEGEERIALTPEEEAEAMMMEKLREQMGSKSILGKAAAVKADEKRK